MRTTIIQICFLLISCSCFSQPWMDQFYNRNKNSDSINFYDIQKAFNEYWKNNKIERSHGWKQFKRWENFMEPRVYPSGKFYPNQLWEETLKSNNDRSLVANWTPMGPYNTPTDINTPAYKRGSGRINCVAFHTFDANTIYVGAPSGGFWKTTTGGNSWATTTDQLASIGVSDIVIDNINPEIIYIATGDGDGASTYSSGILKSTDGGTTWNTTGSSHNITDHVTYRKLIQNPENNNILIAASNNGVYKTTDAGASWSLVTQGVCKDVCFKPGNPSVVYVAEQQQILKSTDSGNSFSPIANSIDYGSVSRIALAVTPANPEIIYALCSGNDGGFYGVYKSTNSGSTWLPATTSLNGNLLGWTSDATGSGGQGWYDLAIAASPLDADIVYVGGVNIWKSTDGGASWAINAHWYGDNGVAYVHADQHYFSFNPHTNEIFSGNDGGLNKSGNGVDWIDLSDGLQILQIYRIGCAATNPNIIVTGSQDNGSMKYDNGNWWATVGGDGMECLIDYTNEDIMYAEIYYGGISKSVDGGISFLDIAPPSAPQGAWITPYVIHPTDHNTLFMGFDDVYKTTDGGDSWSTISSNLTNGNNITTLAVAPSDPQYIYAGAYSSLFKTINGGISWNSIFSGLPNLAIKYLAICPTNPQKIWVTLSGYSTGEKVYVSNNAGSTWTNYSTGLPNLPVNCIVYENNSNDALYVGTDVGVYYRNATMAQWTLFNTGLPNVVVDELEIQYATRKIRAATYGRGLWESDLYEQPTIPDANFSFQIVSACQGIVNFYNASTGVPTQYLWDFGDGSTSTQKNPIHSYLSVGTFQVILHSSNTFGTDSLLFVVTLDAIPVNAAFSADNGASCSTPAIVHFLNNSTNALTYSWDFGDGNTSIDENPVHIYTTAGVYDVKLKVNGGFCGNDSIVNIGIINISQTNNGNLSMPLTAGNNVQTCCSGTLFDSGGQGPYQNNSHSILTIMPIDAFQISLNFLSFDFEPGQNNSCNFDYLAIYDGASINAPLIGLYCNNNTPPSLINSTGSSVTLEQFADPGVTGTGFELSWSCVLSDIQEQNIRASQIKIFPNPLNKKFNISLSKEEKSVSIKLLDITGQPIFERLYHDAIDINIDLPNIAKGIYNLEIITDNKIINRMISVQ